jgi:hypothetical protein
MPTYQELRSTYALMTIPELRDLALRPRELTDHAQAALADELSLRDVLTEYEVPPSLARTSARAIAWHKWWLTIFQAWVTLQIVLFAGGFILLHPIFDGRMLLMLAIVAVPWFGLLLIARKHPSARQFWLGWLAVLLVVQVVIALAVGRLNWRTLIEMATYVAWYVYWLKSRHVAAELSLVGSPATPTEA